MGTNYYLRIDGSPRCPHCGRGEEYQTLHIGKSSYGWCFTLHVIPELDINDLDDWKKWFPRGYIRDEYGEDVTAADMLKVITERNWSGDFTHRTPAWYRSNYGEPGPNGLVRHRVDGVRCIKNGEGTWDCLTGEFS